MFPTSLPSMEQSKRDAGRMVRYAQTEEYAVFAKEAWKEALSCMDMLTRNNLTSEQVHYYRGSLASICDLLRVSYEARKSLENEETNKTVA